MSFTIHNCGSCGFWNITAAKDKAGKVRSDVPVRCGWKSTETYPMSVSGSRPVASYMMKLDGLGCHCWKPRATDNSPEDPA